jgi:hypothetical protein
LREELVEGAQPVLIDFKVRVLGGGWTFAATGREVDNYMASSANLGAEAWCDHSGLAKSSRHATATYGNLVVALMSRAWAHRMQYYYSINVAQEDTGCAYSTADQASCVEPDEVGEGEAGAEAGQGGVHVANRGGRGQVARQTASTMSSRVRGVRTAASSAAAKLRLLAASAERPAAMSGARSAGAVSA